MLNLINSKTNTFEKWQEAISKYFSFDIDSDPEVSSIFDEFYGIIDVDGNNEITLSEFKQIHGAHQHHISDILYEMINLIHNKQKNKPPTTKDMDDEQDFKTDL